MNKIRLFLELFKYGNEVSSKSFWKKQQAVVQPVLYGTLVVGIKLLQAYGVEIQIEDDVLMLIAGALFFVTNTALTLISSKHIGFGKPSEALPEETPDGKPSSAEQPALNEPVEPPEAVVEDVLSLVDMWLKKNK